MKVLLHLNSGKVDKQSELLGNIKNLLEDQGPENIVAVINSDGVEIAEKSEVEEILEGFPEKVHIKICRNSLENREIKEEELINGVEVVPSAVGEIARLQEEGFDYIKI
jgi:intracellular sulfur oxidation DsrE/DsrF family protein